jgi:3-oxoacyl-[acyl-carrier protein] reductase
MKPHPAALQPKLTQTFWAADHARAGFQPSAAKKRTLNAKGPMATTGKLENRTALVTGGSRGIGVAIVRAFAAEGADVAFCHNDDDAGASEVEAAVQAQGRRVFSWRCDIGDMAAARRLFLDAESALGPIDILLNNAGVSEEAPVEAITLEAVDWMLKVHFKATFLLSQLAYISMKARGYGRIINVSPNLAYKGAPGLAHYSAAKAAVLGFTRSFAQEGAARRAGQRDRPRPD